MVIRSRDTTSDTRLREGLKDRDRARRRDRHEAAQIERTPRSRRNDLAPDCPRVVCKLADLTPAKHRVRKLAEVQIARVLASIETYGFIVPVLIRKCRELVDGHIRVEAAKRAGLSEIPCLVVEHLSETELRALQISLNRTAETGEWDLGALEIELKALEVEEFPLEILGFSVQETDGLMAEDAPPEPEFETRGPAVTQLGDSWRLGPHRVVCGDARDAEVLSTLMGQELARLALTDPPYNVPIAGHVTSGDHREFAMAIGEMSQAEFREFLKASIAAAMAHLMEGGLFGSFMDWRSVALLIEAGESLGLELLNLIVWNKTNAGMGSLWRSQHELLPVFKKGTAPHINNVELGKHMRHRSNVWTYAGANTFGSDASQALADHPTPKPIPLLEDALRDVTERKDIVLDPFLGSGSMLLAAERTGRRCRGVELDPIYVDLAVRRWEQLTGKVAMLEETGKSFAETAQERLAPTPVEGDA